MRQALAAEFGIAGEADPAALDQRLIRLPEAGGRGHGAVIAPLAAFEVSDPVEGLNDLLDEFRALAQDRLDDIDRRLREARRIRIPGVVEHVVQQEKGVADRRLVSRHRHLQQKSGSAPDRGCEGAQ